MRIVCDQCQTKYIVPDEKIVKSVLRLTCQKCGHVITTRVEEDPASESGGTLSKWRMTSLNTPKRVGSETPAWYFSHDGESFGPYTQAELLSRLTSKDMSKVVGSCFVWHKSLVDWKPALEVEPFSSAISAPPPPPPPAKPKPGQLSSSLPPLFGDGGAGRVDGLSSGLPGAQQKAAPDMFALKQRLQRTPSIASLQDHSFSASQRESLVRLAHGSAEFQSGVKSSDAPTHPTMSSIDEVFSRLVPEDVRAAAPDDDEAEDSTRVGSPSPFISFQSLDAISPEIRAESSSLPPSKLQRPFPTLSSVPPVASQVSTFKPPSQSVPKIASLFSPSSGDGKSGSGKPGPLPGEASGRPSLPRFPSLKLGASGSSSALPHVASPPSSVSTVSPVAEDEAIDNLPDHKEDIGNLTGGSAQQQVRDLRDDSISDWLPSQPTLVTESRNDALSLDGFQLDGSIFNVSTAESSLPSIELDSIDLDEVKSDSAVAGLSSGVSLEALVFDEDDDAPGAPSELADGRSAIRSGVQASEKGQEDLSEIDLDAAEPVSVADDHVESLSAFGIASDQDDLFASDVHDSGVARVRISVPRLDDIRQRHADLFAEVDAAQSVASDSDSGLSENSMLIQLSHLQNVQRKEKRRTMGVAVIVLAALVLFGLGVVIKRVYDSGSSPVIHGPEFAAVRGTAITADDLDIVAPVDDFALVMAEPVVQRSPSSQGAVRRRDSEPSVGAADGSVSGDAHKGPSATDSAIAAIYGTGSEAPVALPADGRRADGRANVVLQRTESFGSLDGAQGSRYAQMNSNSASSREMFNLGLRIVSQTVQECHRRESKTGSMSQFPKVYIQLTVKPNGVVEQFEVEQKDVPATFIKCLEGKKDRWIFAPFEGAPVKMRQGFILT